MKVRQDNRKNSNKLWYGRTFAPNTLDTNKLAKRIEQNTTVTYADVLAVLSSLVTVMNDALDNSCKVKLDDFGSFSVGVTTTGALQKEDWNITENLKGSHINFQPTRNTDGASKQVTSKALGWGYQAVVLDIEEKKKEGGE